MVEHKFKIGQKIGLANFLKSGSVAPGEYQVVGYRPDQDGEPSYRIKSSLERHDRIVRESELKGIS